MLDLKHSFPRTAAVIDAAQGLHTGGQIYVSRDGVASADAAVGTARPGVAATNQTIFLWYSAGKPLAAVAIAKLREAGLLEWDDPMARHIAEFAVKGKEQITIHDLLTHTAGIRWANFTFSMPWDQIIAAICNTAPERRWVRGQDVGYHPLTSWYLLGEIVRRVDPAHRLYETFVRDEIFQPLGMDDSWLTLTGEQYRAYGDRMGLLENTAAAPQHPLPLDRAEFCHLCVPGASSRGPARELGRFYEMLLRGGTSPDGQPVLSRQSVETLTARHRVGVYDQTFKHRLDWGLGFIINSAQYGRDTVPYGYGPHASCDTFGHGGNQISIGMADPKNRLAIAVIFNGLPGQKAHQQRMNATLAAIYEDLGTTN